MKKKPLVCVVMGSDSDLPVMEKTTSILEEFGVGYEVRISSAHRAAAKTSELAKNAAKRGIQVIIAGAGSAAHLAGVIAAETHLPVIGVPIPSSPLKGIDSLYSIVQMPKGIPVATMAVGDAGAANAGILAVQMLALKNKTLAKKLLEYKEKLAHNVDIKDKNIQKSGKAK